MCLKHFRINYTFSHLGYLAGHGNRKVLRNLDIEPPAGHVDRYVIIAQSQAMGYGGRSATAAAGGQGISGTSFPDFYAYV